MKKSGVWIICAILLAQLFNGVTIVNAAAALTDIVITGYIVDKDQIYEGVECNLTIKYKNISNESLDSAVLEINPDSAFFGTSTNTVSLGPIDDSTNERSITMNLTCTGKSKNLEVIFNYNKAGTEVISESHIITVGKVMITGNNSGPSAPIDTTKFKPRLSAITVPTALSATAGITNQLTFPVKNSSSYAAKAVTVSLEMEKEAEVLENFNLTQSFDLINANETRNAVFQLKVSASAPAGVYPVKVTYNCSNPYGDIMDPVTETIYLKILNSNTAPLLAVDSFDINPSAAVPGENVEVKINIANLGNLPANDITATLKGMKSNGFILNNTAEVKSIKTIDGGSTASVIYKLKASAGIPSGSNELQVKIDYSDGTTAKTSENQIFIPVSRTGAGKGLVIQDIKSPKGTLISNKDFKVSFTLANTSLTDISDIKVTLANDKDIICKSMNSYMIDTLGKGESRKFEFTLYAAGEAITKNYPLSINIEYGDAQGENAARESFSQYLGVFIDNGASGKSVPRLIIDNYKYSPEQINAGDEFTLDMSYLNTSRLVDISNIKVTVSSDDGTFTPVNSSNTFFIDVLKTKQNIQKTLVLKAKPSAEPKAYALSITFDYEDDKGNQYNTKETISIPVQQLPKLVTGELMLPGEAFAGQPATISVEFYNMGKVTLYNLMVKAEGDFQAVGSNYYVGNLEPGRSDSYEVQITPNAVGDMKGNVIFEFEDVGGKQIQVKKDFTINVTEMVVQETDQGALGPDGKPIDPNARKGLNILYIIIAAVVLVIAGIIIFVIIRKKRIKRRELSIDE